MLRAGGLLLPALRARAGTMAATIRRAATDAVFSPALLASPTAADCIPAVRVDGVALWE